MVVTKSIAFFFFPLCCLLIGPQVCIPVCEIWDNACFFYGAFQLLLVKKKIPSLNSKFYFLSLAVGGYVCSSSAE